MRADAFAGINVAMLDFPQGMAYAMIAGLPFHIGIQASILASGIGPFFASSRFVMLGPTNAIAVMCLASFLSLGLTQSETLETMPLFLLMVSVFMLVGSAFKLANLVNYVSRTVITGYITAAALLIIIKQLNHVLGIEAPSSGTLIISLQQTLLHLHQISWNELAMGCLTIAVYATMRSISPRLPAVAIALCISFFIARALSLTSIELHSLAGENALLPGFSLTLPKFSLEMVSSLAPGALAVSFLSLLESSSISKTLAAQAGDTIDSNQQMASMGFASLGCAFLGGMPVSGSLTRSMLNFRSGAVSSISSIFSASFLAALFFLLGPHMGKIPKASLAALVIMVGVSLFNKKNIRYALGTTDEDRIVFLLTFASGLFFTLNTAIFVGMISSMLLFIKKASIPSLIEYALTHGEAGDAAHPEAQSIALLHVEGDLFFASSDLFLNQARNLANHPQLKVIIVRMRNAHNLDATCAMALEQFVSYARDKSRHVIISGANSDLMDILLKSRLISTIGEENVIREDPGNPTLSTSLALKRAVSLIGKNADLKLFISSQDDASA